MTLRLSGGRRLQSPPGATTRPTAARVRQAVFNLLAAELPGCRWLDLCCGSGVMACEALQRGASEVVAIERDRRVVAVARANLAAVAAGFGTPSPRFRVIQADARRWLAGCAPAGEIGAGREDSTPGERDGSGEVSAGRSEVRDHNGCARSGESPSCGSDLPVRKDHNPSRGPGRKDGGETLPAVGAERESPFDLIYCDPPWPAGLHAQLTEAVVRGGWIRATGTLVWECPSGRVPATPDGWVVRDARRYGSSTVVLLEPR